MLIATYQYKDPELQQLEAAAHDAESLAGVLKDPNIAGFEVTTLINQPHYIVGESLGDFLQNRRRDDLTLIYITGHGIKDDDGKLYFAMTNTRRESLLFTSLSAEQVNRAMENCRSRRQVLVLDCCYSGAFPVDYTVKADTAVNTFERFKGHGRTILTASDSTQFSFVGNSLKGQAAQSIFTRHLVAGIQSGDADLDRDGDITVDELYDYVYERVTEEMPSQRPKKRVDIEGRLVIAKNINWSLPSYLKNLINSQSVTDRRNAIEDLKHLYEIGNLLVQASVTEETQRLVEDDSRTVSEAAKSLLRSIMPQPLESPSPDHTRDEYDAKREAEERAKREAEERAKREAEERAKREAEERAKREAEERAKREAEERAKREAEERAKREAEERAKREAEEQAKREAEERAKREAEERAKREAEERAKREAEERAKREAEERAKREAEERAKREAEERAKREAEERAKREAEERAKREAEERAKREAEERAKREAEERAKREAEERAKREAEERAKREAEERAKREAEERAKREAEGPHLLSGRYELDGVVGRGGMAEVYRALTSCSTGSSRSSSSAPTWPGTRYSRRGSAARHSPRPR